MSSVPVKVVDAKGNIHWLCALRKHRTDGPAVEDDKDWGSDGKAWYINGEELTEAEFNQEVKHHV